MISPSWKNTSRSAALDANDMSWVTRAMASSALSRRSTSSTPAATGGSNAEVISSQGSSRGFIIRGPRDRHALPLAGGELGRPTENVLRPFAGKGRSNGRVQVRVGY